MWTVHAILLTFQSLHIPSIKQLCILLLSTKCQNKLKLKKLHIKNIVCTKNLKSTTLEYKIKNVTLYNI